MDRTAQPINQPGFIQAEAVPPEAPPRGVSDSASKVGLRPRLLRWAWRIARSARRRLAGPSTTYVDERRSEYHRYWREAAAQLQAEFAPLTDRVWEVRRNGRSTRISNYVVQADDLVTLRLAGDKGYCYRVAAGVGTRVPEHRVVPVDGHAEAREFLAAVGPLVVVKPARATSSGLGITTNITTVAQLERAVALASLFCDEILVERMVPGESCRLLFLDNELVHAVRRRGTRIVGDGVSPVRALLRAVGVRGNDPEVRAALAQHSTGLDDVLPADAMLVVRGRPPAERSRHEVRTVYDEPIVNDVGPALLDELQPIVAALRTRFAGVDIVTSDPRRSLRETGGAFIEINTTPGIHHHYIDEDVRRSNSVAVRVLDQLLA